MTTKKATIFEPEFREDLTVVAPNGKVTQINPRYCLTNESADALVRLLREQGLSAMVLQLAPLAAFQFGQWRQFGGGFNFNDTVPWIGFLDSPEGNVGTRMNAGQMADAFTHGYPHSYAINYMLRGYAWDAYDQGFGGPPPMTPVTA